MANVEIREERARTFLGFEYIGSNPNQEIGKLWDERLRDLLAIEGPKELFGVSLRVEGLEAGAFRYLALAETAPETEATPPLHRWQLDAGPVAVAISPTLADIPRVIGELYSDWLPTSGYTAREGVIEYYPPAFPNPEAVEIWLPISK